jgi:hypothetical protein
MRTMARSTTVIFRITIKGKITARNRTATKSGIIVEYRVTREKAL